MGSLQNSLKIFLTEYHKSTDQLYNVQRYNGTMVEYVFTNDTYLRSKS